jgi:hypothetical protein
VKWLSKEKFKMSKIEKFWQDATADDVARVMAGETVEARFRDIETDPWCSPRDLTGVKAVGDNKLRWFTLTSSWRYCQVYREPSWYANKPDPGPGFRLLEKLPDEELKPGDEGWDLWHDGKWSESDFAKEGKPQQERTWYRRRIEPVEPKFAVGQMVRVVGPKATDARHWDSEMARHAGTLQTIKYIEEFANPTEIFYGVYGIDSRKFWEDHLEAVEPEPKHYVLRVGDSCETPNGNRIKVISQDGTQSFVNFGVGDKVKTIHGQTITITEKGFEVTQ